MKVKSYDDIILIDCERKKHYHLFDMLEGGKWIDIDGKSQFAISRVFEEQVLKIIENYEKENPKLDKYNKDVSIIAKEEFYKSFDSKKPVNFNKLNTIKKSIGSLSSSTYDSSSSSDGFPSPRTPGRESDEEDGDEDEEDGDVNEDIEFLFEKIEELEKRIERLESGRRK